LWLYSSIVLLAYPTALLLMISYKLVGLGISFETYCIIRDVYVSPYHVWVDYHSEVHSLKMSLQEEMSRSSQLEFELSSAKVELDSIKDVVCNQASELNNLQRDLEIEKFKVETESKLADTFQTELHNKKTVVNNVSSGVNGWFELVKYISGVGLNSAISYVSSSKSSSEIHPMWMVMARDLAKIKEMLFRHNVRVDGEMSEVSDDHAKKNTDYFSKAMGSNPRNNRS